MPELLKQDTELVMREAFWKKANEIIANESGYTKGPETVKVGLELEYSLLDSSFGQAPEQLRDTVIREVGDIAATELGASQIELRTDPIDVQEAQGFRAIYESLLGRQRQIQESARRLGMVLLSSGSNPFVPIEDIQRTNKPKYEIVPTFYNDNRGDVETIIGEEGLDVGEAAIMSLFNSVQANIEAKSFEDAIDKANRSFMVGPLVVAITSNARFVELKDSSFDDVRMMAWSLSHDTRSHSEINKGIPTRVGLPADYYKHLEEYFDDVSSYPLILDDIDHAFEVGIGLNWRDTRVKFIGSSAVVEFRPVSSQPTPEANVAAMAFYVGRLLWSQKNKESLLPINLIQGNHLSAMADGHRSMLWVDNNGRLERVPASDVLPIEIERALVGLEESNVGDRAFSEDLLSILRNNLVEGTPAARLNERVRTSPGGRVEALSSGFDRQRATYY